MGTRQGHTQLTSLFGIGDSENRLRKSKSVGLKCQSSVEHFGETDRDFVDWDKNEVGYKLLRAISDSHRIRCNL